APCATPCPTRRASDLPSIEQAPDVEWTAQSVMRYHGRLSDLAADTLRAQANGATTLFVMPSFGVAERVAEILGEYDVSAGLALRSEEHTSELQSPDHI